MAKNKKSKILAMALCASVMTGIYASPVMAAPIEVSGSSTLEIEGDREYTITSGTLNLDGDGIAKALNGKNINLGTGSLIINDKNIGNSVAAIRRVVNEDTGMSATYLEETVKAHSAFGLQVLDEDGKAVATISRNGTGEFNGPLTANKSLTALDVDSKAKSVLGVSGVQLYNSDGTNKVNITNSGASRFGSFDETNVRIEGGALKIMAANNAAVSGPLVAQLSEDGLTLVDANRKYSTLTAAQLANLNSTIKEGGVVDANELNVSGATGGLYVKDVTNDDDVTGTMIYTKAADGKTNTMWIDPNTGNLNTVGSIGVGSNLAKPVTQINGIADANGDGVGDINVGISYNEDGSVAGKKINLDASTGDINLVDGAKVDGVDVSKLSTAATDISDLQNRTQYITGASRDTTYFKGAIRSTGDISSGNGAVTLSGNYKKEAAVTLRDAKDKTYTLTATQLGNINNMITGAGVLENVVSINGAAVEGVGDGGLKISDVTLENGGIWAEKLNGKLIEEYVTDEEISGDLENIGGIERKDVTGEGKPGEGTTTIENLLNVSGDSVSASLGNNSFTFDNSGFKFTGVVNLGSASDIYFNYGGVGNGTDYAGSYTLEDLADTVADIYDRTQAIDYENGKTTIKGDLDVVKDPNAGSGEGDDPGTGEGGNTGNGNGHYDGNLDVDGGITAGDSTIGGVGLEGGTVTADKVVTGNTTLDNEGLNVGGQTSVTADGVNVGGNGGTTVSKDGVSIADKTIISDHDVVINEGTADRVSLSETADRVGNLEQGVSELNNRVGELEDRIDKVGAMAAAIANLRTMGYDPAAPTEVAVGIGQYRDETGAALGLFHYPNRDFMLSLSVSTSGDEVMGGIGATWKFGRKSPEKVAEIKKAQAEADVRRAEEAKLAKAEEMKQAAKEAKIKAQQERHAKLAAERAAQAEAAK